MFLDDPITHNAQASPDAQALCMLGQGLSYAALNEQVDQIATVLLERSVAKGDRVIICAAKSPLAIAAIYAVLRIGAIYVPIDPAAPVERLAAQIANVSPVLIIADATRLGALADSARSVPLLDLGQPMTGKTSPDKLRDRCAKRSADDPAYILMTSGTTGSPKGIVHTHKSGLAYAQMAANLCALRSSDRVSHHTPAHFDMSIFDIFSTAVAGACVVIIPEMHAKLPASLSELTQSEGITVWYSVPYALIQMVERGALAERDLSALRIVMFAGEKMPPAALKAFSNHAPNAVFLNAYGPTETNHCTTSVLKHDDLDGTSPLPIGLPDVGVTARIGPDSAEASTGELLIAGDQVMSQYWNAPDQTAATFCTLPDSSGQIRRFYCTGDIVRRTETGALMLIGRKDRQIKLRGYRIELDEVELALVNTPFVTEAVVMARDQALRAFVTGASKCDLEQVKRQVESVLPPYAVPQHIEWLESMPRTSTGKIDRAKLVGKADEDRAA